ncbi:MAG TPA: RNA pseudouridine synthase [Acidimicrobiaceae bacterium]|nr:RNA pseudouridine synthase [Acidimicrobiaceae bacterium]
MIVEIIPAALAGERLDRIVALIAECSRSEAAQLIAAGGVQLDEEVEHIGKRRVKADQVVAVDPSMLPVAGGPEPDPSVEFTVVHADEHLIVVDKPAGLVVHPGAGNPSGTLVNGLLARFPELEGVGEPHRPGIVHRLDVGTSGLLAVARTSRAYHVLVDALAARDVGRVYRALVWGHLANPHGVVDAPIGRDHRDPMRMAVVVDGRPSRTRYRVVREYRTPTEVSSLECRLESGRTHQIRVHLSAIGHPVVGDATYGGVRAHIHPPRPFLHAAALELDHPVSRESMRFESALPDDLAEIEAELVANDSGTPD